MTGFLYARWCLGVKAGAGGSRALLGMNCLRAADCVLAVRNVSTTELTTSLNKPDREIGATSRKTFSFLQISVRFNQRCHSTATKPAIVRPTGELLDHHQCQAPALIHFLEDIFLVGLKNGHGMKHHTCLTSRYVGIPHEGGRGSTRLRRKKRAGLPRCQHVLNCWNVSIALLHRTNQVGEVRCHSIDQTSGKRLFPGF